LGARLASFIAVLSLWIAATPVAHADPIVDATATRDSMIDIALNLNYDPNGVSIVNQLMTAWRNANPGVHFGSWLTIADSTTISTYFDFVFEKSTGTDVLTFAVADDSGGCAGGAVEVFDGNDGVPPRFLPVDMRGVARCDALAAMLTYTGQ